MELLTCLVVSMMSCLTGTQYRELNTNFMYAYGSVFVQATYILFCLFHFNNNKTICCYCS